ncbi:MULTISPECIES: glycosyltransferase family 4 protein [unclassified Erythrobacter]|uniref:glycosyltransferase family 4 protein n=1 Tax=Erythrobacteraceae TaxID=335929 RepID=UPI00076D3FF0|nr:MULTISPECIES: glycosyltransferase family 4 protein [unclassified Erythrobacter]KWV94125.1 hypothetical protein ASS64_09815 [Erythrobacter sp. AP23]MBO6527396.1 glycosyltransferase family 4 protein [Erythrobacter sp.]MBO6530780.1 glycosyltransferase family 4 protein [Erythrobacter sp.]
MIRMVHLLDDFGMGGVTRALSLFDDPRLTRIAHSCSVAMGRGPGEAPRLEADIIVIHVPPCWSRLPYLMSLRLRNPGARIVQVEHSYTRAFEADQVASPIRFRTLLRTAARLVDEVVAVSEAQREWLADVGVPQEKLATINPWCGREELYAIPDLQPRQGPLKLLAYGRLAREKNFAALIEAMTCFRADEVMLTLFGAGPEEDRLTALAESLDNVRLQPSTNELAPRLAACDAVIVPSRYEAFGLVATEARMAGRPLLVADVDGLTAQLRGGAGFAAPIHGAADIASGIVRLMNADLPAMGRAARAGVTRQHDAIISGWLAVIQRAAERNPATADARSARIASA